MAYSRKIPPHQSTAETRYEIRQQRGCALLIDQPVADTSSIDRAGLLRIVNPNYGFELRRNDPDAPWAVSKYQPGLKYTGIWDPMSWTKKVAAYPITLAALGTGVEDPVAEKGFKPLRVSPITHAGKGMLRVDFQFEPSDTVRQWLRRGWIVYDPSAKWVQRECHLEIERPMGSRDNLRSGTTTAVFHYREANGSFPLLQKIVSHYEVPAVGFVGDETIECQLALGDPSEEEFTLSAFGFPEPVDAPPLVRSTRAWYIWLCAAGIMCLVAAVFWRRLAVARQQTPKAVAS